MLSAGGQRLEETQDEFSSASFHHTAMTPLFTSPIYLHTECLPPCLACVCICYCVCPCVKVRVCAGVCLYMCELSVSAHSQWWSEVRWTLYIVLYGVRTCCVAHQCLNKISVLWWDGWNAGTLSHLRDSGSFFIKVYSGASPEVSQVISATDSPLTRFQFYFPCHLFRLASIPLALSSPDGFSSHPICPPANMREPLSLGGTKVFYPIPQPHFGSERNGPFLYVSHTCTHTHTHTKMVPTVPSFYSPRLWSCIFASYKTFFLFVLPGPLWSMTTKRERTHNKNK